MFKDYEDLVKQMEFEMQRCSAEAMRRFLEIPGGAREFWLPRTDVYETENDVVARIELAGIKKESLSVILSGDRRSLAIRGTRGECNIDKRKKIRYYQLEVYFGPFERIVTLPSDVSVDSENLCATYKDGFLIVTMPKSREAQTSRNIPIEEQDGEEFESTA